MGEHNAEIAELEIESVADLAEQVVYRLPGCDPVMVRKTLQAAYADFARVTKCFTGERELETQEGVQAYPVLPSLPQMYVDSICAVWLDGRRLRMPQDCRTAVLYGTPVVQIRADDAANSRYSLARPDGSVTAASVRREVESRAYEPQKLKIRFVELPKMGSEDAPRGFLDKYGEAVVAGALVRLFNMTGKAWTDTAQAQSELVRYENFTTQARLDSVDADSSPVGNGHVETLDMSVLL